MDSKALALLAVIVISLQMTSLASSGTSKSFVKTWGWKSGATGAGVTLDHAGNIYVTGEADSGTSSSKVLLLKYNQTGGLIWQKVWGGEKGFEAGYALAIDPNGNIYVTGWATDFDQYQVGQAFLLKYDSSGNLLWQKAWGSSTTTLGSSTRAYAIALDSSGGIYVTGSINLWNNSNALVLLKFNQSGNMIWQKAWTGNYTQEGLGLVADETGGIYVAGYTSSYDVQSPNGNIPQTFCSIDPCFDGLLLKFNSTGDLQWQTIWRQIGVYVNVGSSIALDPLGDILVGGYAAIQVNVSLVHVYATVSKFTGNGSILWHRTWRDNVTGPSNDPTSPYSRPEYNTRNQGIAANGTGDIYAIGSDAGNLYIMRLGSDGRLLSQSVLTGLSTSGDAGEVTIDSSGAPVMVGSIHDDPFNYKTTSINQTLDAQKPMSAAPAGTLRNLNVSTVNLSGGVVNIDGSVTYIGGSNVWLNYGSSFAVAPAPRLANPLVNPLEAVLLGLIPIGVIAILIRREAHRKITDSKSKSA